MGTLASTLAVQGGLKAANYVANKDMVGIQKEASSELQAQQNAFQHEENELDRQWQEATWLEHFLKENEEYAKRLGLQQHNWQSQFDITNAYNNPSAQVSRLLAAGFNPSAMMQNSGLVSLGQSGASPSAASATAPNGVPFAAHGVSPASSASFGGLSSQAANFSSIAQMADSIGKLQQVGLNVSRQAALLPHEVDKAASEADLAHQKALLTEIEKNVASAWLDKKAGAEFNKLVSDSYAAYTQGDLNKANELLSSANERLVSLEGEIKSEQRPQLLANLKELQNVYRSEQEKNRASATASYASAEQSLSAAEFNRAMATTENDLREGKKTAQILANGMQRIQNQLARRENMRDIATNDMRIYSILKECERSGYATSEQLERWKIAMKDNDYYEMKIVLSEINSIVQSVATVAAPVAGARALSPKPPVQVTRNIGAQTVNVNNVP